MAAQAQARKLVAISGPLGSTMAVVIATSTSGDAGHHEAQAAREKGQAQYEKRFSLVKALGNKK